MGVQAIANLSVNANVAKAVAEDGGINILTNLARSMNRLVAEEAAGGLWNLSVGEEHKVVCCAVFLTLFLFLYVFPTLMNQLLYFDFRVLLPKLVLYRH